MKNETLNYSTITVAEVWQPSVLLRNVERVLSSSNFHCEKGLVLQQLYTSNLGNREWRDVPTETEA